jgi:hypothetical protein
MRVSNVANSKSLSSIGITMCRTFDGTSVNWACPVFDGVNVKARKTHGGKIVDAVAPRIEAQRATVSENFAKSATASRRAERACPMRGLDAQIGACRAPSNGTEKIVAYGAMPCTTESGRCRGSDRRRPCAICIQHTGFLPFWQPLQPAEIRDRKIGSGRNCYGSEMPLITDTNMAANFG